MIRIRIIAPVEVFTNSSLVNGKRIHQNVSQNANTGSRKRTIWNWLFSLFFFLHYFAFFEQDEE